MSGRSANGHGRWAQSQCNGAYFPQFILRLFVGFPRWHGCRVGHEKPRWRRVAFAIEFWFALLLTVGAFLYGAWHAVRTLAE